MQGSCLAPLFFALYINDVIINCNRSGLGFVLVYADDILLISRSVVSLQKLVDLVYTGLSDIMLNLNVDKTYCLRVGPRFDHCCASIFANAQSIPWSDTIKYLGVHVMAAKKFSCSFSAAKSSFNRGVNAIFSKVGTACEATVVTHLINSKCVPSLLFGSEALELTKSVQRSLDFAFNRFFYKIFRTRSSSVVEDSLKYIGVASPSEQVASRTKKFVEKFYASDNIFCKMVCILKEFNVRGEITCCYNV
jgi:hypothetical protein